VARLASGIELTGLSLDEIINSLLADKLKNFRPDNDDSYPHETVGCWKFKDRANAERTLRGSIDAFVTGPNGECEWAC
jgi:hypothetical protein